MRSRIIIFVAIIQSILFLGHWFVYRTVIDFWGASASSSMLATAFALLSASFVVASLLAHRSFNALARMLYTASAVWLGVFSFSFFAAILCWLVLGLSMLIGLPLAPRTIAATFFGMALLASLYGVINAARTRVKRISVRLPNLPESWRGRVAAQVSDTHLGHVRSHRFLRRLIATLTRLEPDVVFITGDLFDGTHADLQGLAKLWAGLAVPLGAYFIAGNHDGFTGHAKHIEAVEQAGIRVLNNELIEVDGLQLLGVHYHDAADAGRFRSILQDAAVDRDRASILLTHAPSGLRIAEEQGISLQLAGHTHGGQFFPFTWIVARVWGRFAYGLKRLGNLLVYTSSGAGTWGPPMRVGTTPEIVLISFE